MNNNDVEQLAHDYEFLICECICRNKNVCTATMKYVCQYHFKEIARMNIKGNLDD